MSSKMSQFATVFFICNYLIFQGGLVQVSATTQMREAEVGCHEDSCGTQGDVIIREEEEGDMKDMEMGLLQNRVKKVHTTGRVHGGKSAGSHSSGFPFGLKTSDRYGIPGYVRRAEEFDDYGWSGLQAFGIKQIQMWYCTHCYVITTAFFAKSSLPKVCSIQVTYTGGLVKNHGSNTSGSNVSACTKNITFDLDENDVITKARIVSEFRKKSDTFTPLVLGLQFFTKTGRASPYVGTSCYDLVYINCQTFPAKASSPPNVGIFSFKGRGGLDRKTNRHGIFALQFYYADSIDSCNAIKKMTGEWQPFYYNNGAFTIELQEGTTHENEEVDQVEWGKSASVVVEQGFEFGGASVSTEIGGETSHSIGEEYSSSFASSSTSISSASFDTGGQLWSWVFTTLDSCKGKSRTFKDYVMTRNVDQPPCCLPGYAKDVYTQFGPCAEGVPQENNQCIRLGLNKHPEYGVQYPDNTVVDQNLKFGDRDINIRLTDANKTL